MRSAKPVRSTSSEESWLEETVAGLPCRVLLPASYEPHLRRYPLVVSLHGSGERGVDNRAQLRNGLATFEALRHEHPCIVVAPQLPEGETWGGSWYAGETAGQRALVALVRDLRARASVDAHRVYAVGYSMGAIGLWDILVRHPGLFTAAVLIAGDLDVSAATALTTYPLWTIVGGRDDIVPPDNTRSSRARRGRPRRNRTYHGGLDRRPRRLEGCIRAPTAMGVALRDLELG